MELSVELPLEDDKFTSLQENDPKIWDLHDKVKEGVYSKFYIVENNVLFRSIVDNGHKFKARVIPKSLVDVVLHLGHNQLEHNGYQRTYAAIKHLYYRKGMRHEFCDTAKVARYVLYRRFRKHNLKNKYLNQEYN